MRPHTENIPKALLPVGGEPFAAHQLRWLARHDVTRVVYCIGYLGDQIRMVVGDGSAWNLDVVYVDEADDLRGTGGAVRLAIDEGRVTDDAFLLTYGDSLLDINVGAVRLAFARSGQPALMTVIENDGSLGTSNAAFDGAMVTNYSKGAPPDVQAQLRYVDYGLSVFTTQVITELIPAGTKADLSDAQRTLSRQGRLAGMLAEHPFLDIGSPEGWKTLDALLAHPEPG